MPSCSSDNPKQQSKAPSCPDASPMPCLYGTPVQVGGNSSAPGQRESVTSCTTEELCGCSIKLLVTLCECGALPLTVGHS